MTLEQSLVTGTDSILVCPQYCPPSQRLAGKRQQEHLAFEMTQPVLMLQGTHTDTTPALDIRWDSPSPDTAPSCLVAAHPRTNPLLLSGIGSSATALTQTDPPTPSLLAKDTSAKLRRRFLRAKCGLLLWRCPLEKPLCFL